MDGTVLIADDDRTIRTVLTQALTRAGCKVHATSSLGTLLRWVAEGRGDVVVSDVIMPDGNGLEMLPKISQERPELPVIVISAQNSIMTAIQASEAKAYDYLPKPFDLPDLMARISGALGQNPHARAPMITDQFDPEGLPLIGRSDVMQSLYRVISQLRNADIPLLICGESGTGKSLIARVLHDYSARCDHPFICVSEEDLSDRQSAKRILEQAENGTVILEDISEISQEKQSQIIWMLDQKTPKAPRFIATSQNDLTQSVAASGLRKDLYFRISGDIIQVPPLRERIDDIPLLFEYFFAKYAENPAQIHRLSPEALEGVRSYEWPGNLRQLEHLVKRVVLTHPQAVLQAADIHPLLRHHKQVHHTGHSPYPDENLGDSVARHLQRYFALHEGALPPPGVYHRIVREVEYPLIQRALQATDGNQAKCAQLLGINRNTLRKKMNELNMEATRSRKLM